MAPTGFEHGDKAVTIGADADDGVVDRRPHSRLVREVNDAIGRDLVEHARHRGKIREVDLVEAAAKPGRCLSVSSRARFNAGS